MRILAIDPGNYYSAYCLVDSSNLRPVAFDKIGNDELLVNLLHDWVTPDRALIEMVASYGMAVGADVFETCVWIGRFQQALANIGVDAELVKRNPVKLHHCGSPRAKDANITQALVDRFASGQPNHGKGTKAAPCWFYGFRADVWQAYALAVYAADTAQESAA